MNTLRIYLLVVLAFISSVSLAQDDGEGQRFLDKIFVGGGLGAGFGDFTFINVSPIIGYRVTPRLSTGLRFMYQYVTFDYRVGTDREKFQGNDFSVGAFTRFMVKGPFYLQAEYEHLNYEDLDFFDGSSIRSNFDSFMAGGGMAQPVGGKAFFFMTAMYNFSYDGFNTNNAFRSPYDSPWVIRVGMAAGF